MDDTMMSKERIAEYLTALRDEKGMTLSEWEQLSDVPATTIKRLLSAQTDSPQFRTVAALVLSASGSLDDLLGLPCKVETKYITVDDSTALLDRQERDIEYLKNQVREQKKQLYAMRSVEKRLRLRVNILHYVIGFFLILSTALLVWDLCDPNYGFLYRVGQTLHQNTSRLWRVG